MEYVKICGLKKTEDIQICAEYGANALGFIYNVPDSSRNLSKEKLYEILPQIPNTIKKVVVSRVNNTSEVEQLMKTIDADLYQLHCSFNIRDLYKFSMEDKKKMIIAFKVDQASKDNVIRQINQSFNQFFAFLIDNSQGSGIEIDFELVIDIQKNISPSKIIIAGGIDIENVEALIKYIRPYGIDVSSSLEEELGVKDPNKIKKFLEVINNVKINS